MRIIRQILTILMKIVVSLLVIALTAVLVWVTVSGPYSEPPEQPPVRIPDIDELIPQGSRRDSDLMVNVLFGEAVVEMPLERYLIGAVAAEMPASFEIEALKAQAVAARTRVLYGIRVAPNSRHPYAEVCTDHTCCMAYISDDALRESWEGDYIRNITKIIGTVLDTDGIYLSYNREPILAVFHSSSAGMTEASGSVWIADLPYLASVGSPETANQVPDFISTVAVQKDDFKKTVTGSYPGSVFGANEMSWITDISRTESGRISGLYVGGIFIKGTELRSLFDLRSTAVDFMWADGEIIFTVTGYGHGVGMSQYGANAMAMERINYRLILSHYYTGAVIIDS